jgi:integrase
MQGTITKTNLKNGRISWGYYFLSGKALNGKRRQTTKQGFATKREAEDALRIAIEKKRQGPGASLVTPMFREFFKRWMEEHATRKCSPKTIERYGELGAYAIRQVVEISGNTVLFGDVPLDKFGPMQMELVINSLADRGGQKTKEHPDGRPLSAKTVRHIACVVHGCFEKAVKWQLINRNPMDGIDMPRLTKKTPKIVEKDDVRKLLERAKATRLYALIMLDLATGARRGELLALQWRDVDFETGIMHITKSLEQTKAGLRVKSTKSGKPRKFSIPAVAVDALQDHWRLQQADRDLFGSGYRDNQLVFCRPDGCYYSPDRVGARVAELMRKAGLFGVSLHSLRHTHASELLSCGVPIPTVAKRLGHANANVTLSIYAHALEADELAAAKIWNDAMTRVMDAQKRLPERSLGKSRSTAKKLA